MSSRFAPRSVGFCAEDGRDALRVVDVGGDDAGQRGPRQSRGPGPRGQRVGNLRVAQPRQRARHAVRVHDRDEPVRLGEAVVVGPAPDEAREVNRQDRAARLAFDDLVAVEQVQQPRHVPGSVPAMAASWRTPKGPVPVRQRAHDPARLGRVQRPRRLLDRPGAALLAADEMNTVGRSSTSRMLPTMST